MRAWATSGFPALILLGCVAMISARSSLYGVHATREDVAAGSRALGSKVLMYTRTPQYLPQAWMNAGERFPRGGTIV